MSLLRVWFAANGMLASAIGVLGILVIVLVFAVKGGWIGDDSEFVLQEPAAAADGQSAPGEAADGELGEDTADDGAAGEEPTDHPDESGEPGGESGADDDDPANPFADVVGTYRLVEQSAHDALRPLVVEFLSGEGVLVVDTEGVVSGDLSYRAREWEGQDCRTVEAENCFVPLVHFEGTLAGAHLEATNGGFAFTATMMVVLQVTERNHPELGLLPPFTREIEMPVAGVVDPDAGTIGLSDGEFGSGEMVFRR